MDRPLYHLPLRKLQRLCQGRRKVDIKLRAFFALDALNLRWIAHLKHLVFRLDHAQVVSIAFSLVSAKLQA